MKNLPENMPQTLSGFVMEVAKSMETKHVFNWNMDTFGTPVPEKGTCIGCVATNYFLSKGFPADKLAHGGVSRAVIGLPTKDLWEDIENAIDYLRQDDTYSFFSCIEEYYPVPGCKASAEYNLNYIGSAPTADDIVKVKLFAKQLALMGY